MKLTILNVAYPLVPVSLDTAGGAEQIVAAIDRGLTARGHTSLVLAAAGSRVHGTLIPSPVWTKEIDSSVRAWAAREHAAALASVLLKFPIDVVHLHGLDFAEYLPESPVPCLVTLHLPPDWYPRSIFRLNRPNTTLNCVSASQRARIAAPLSVRVVLDGIDTALFEKRAVKRDYAAVIGRVCPEKGFHHAIDAATRAGIPLIMAGEVFAYPAHLRYVEKEILPRLSRCVRFIGPVGLRKKRRLLATAKCVLIPSTAPETSSLVAMESLASGTPVIAFPNGALPEIIEHGKTGFLAASVAQMADAIRRAAGLDPEDCRRAARTRFSAARMVDEYVGLYRELVRASAPASIVTGV